MQLKKWETVAIPTGILVTIALGSACADGEAWGVNSTQKSLVTDSLNSNQDRLLSDWAYRKGERDICGAWHSLDPSAQGVFLSIMHRLQISSFSDGACAERGWCGPVLDHVVGLHEIRGAKDPDSCGGSEYNRLFMSMDDALREAFHWEHFAESGRFVDVYGNSDWRPSSDIFGPHSPFNGSAQTSYGHPRGQVHFFLKTGETEVERVCRADFCIEDPNVLEMDQDYNWKHDSSTECFYSGRMGRTMYEQTHPPVSGLRDGVDWSWQPSACSGEG